MRIDKKLNIAIPLEREDGGTFYVHSTPLSREMFEQYFLPISMAWAQIHQTGLRAVAGPRVAALMLKKAAEQLNVWEGPGGVMLGLMPEIRRLSNVVAPGPGGWATMPYQDAATKGFISAEDQAEVENAVCFFTLSSAMHRRQEMPVILGGMTALWDTLVTSLNSTEFAVSLQTSTVAETSTERVVSSVPS